MDWLSTHAYCKSWFEYEKCKEQEMEGQAIITFEYDTIMCLLFDENLSDGAIIED